MVEGLAARLKSQPQDAQGWQRLVRAYSVLRETEKAQAALSDGRAALKADARGLAALNAEAKADGLK
jgi:cytochrome c-type biogenesis protein CcmH